MSDDSSNIVIVTKAPRNIRPRGLPSPSSRCAVAIACAHEALSSILSAVLVPPAVEAHGCDYRPAACATLRQRRITVGQPERHPLPTESIPRAVAPIPLLSMKSSAAFAWSWQDRIDLEHISDVASHDSAST